MVLSFNFIAVGLSDLNLAIERSTFDEQLHCLIVKLTCTQIAAKDRFETKHGGFSNQATMTARIPFPAFASMLADMAQIFITRMRLAVAIAMLQNFTNLGR